MCTHTCHSLRVWFLYAAPLATYILEVKPLYIMVKDPRQLPMGTRLLAERFRFIEANFLSNERREAVPVMLLKREVKGEDSSSYLSSLYKFSDTAGVVAVFNLDHEAVKALPEGKSSREVVNSSSGVALSVELIRALSASEMMSGRIALEEVVPSNDEVGCANCT